MAKTKFRLTVIILLALMIILSAGCVERKLTINTSPQGGLVYLNDEEIGQTPVTVEFNWYGDYKVRIEKDGYQTLNTHRQMIRPWHDSFPFDFFAEVLWPQQIVEHTEWQFQLTEYTPPERQQLINQARQMNKKISEKSNLSLQPDQN